MKLFKQICLSLLLGCCFCCQTIRPSSETSTLTTIEKIVPVDVEVKGTEVSAALDCDSLNRWLQVLKAKQAAGINITDTIIIPDKSGKLLMKFYLDNMGNLISSCEQKDKVITALTKQLETKQVSKEVKIQTIKKTPVWVWMVLGISLFLNLILVIYAIYKFFIPIP